VERYVTAAKKFGISITGTEIKVWSAALMLADVFLNDAAYAVKSWADVTGIQIRECIIMRKTFLQTINYSLGVTMKEYDDWVARLNVISDHVNSVLAYKARQGYIQQEMVYQSLMKQPQNQPYVMSCPDVYLNSNNRTPNNDYERRPSNDIYQAVLGASNVYDINHPMNNGRPTDLVVFKSLSPSHNDYARTQNHTIPNTNYYVKEERIPSSTNTSNYYVKEERIPSSTNTSNYFVKEERIPSSIKTTNYYVKEERNYSANNNIPTYSSQLIYPTGHHYQNQNYARISNSINQIPNPSNSTPGNFEYQSSAETLIKSPMSFKYQKSQRSFVDGDYLPPPRQYDQGWKI
jgi:hypothetical protein